MIPLGQITQRPTNYFKRETILHCYMRPNREDSYMAMEQKNRIEKKIKKGKI
jgi:hypothetical protein